MPDAEIVFQVRESPEGGYEARAVGYSIFTEGDDREHLKEMMRDAVLCHFDDGEAPQAIRVAGSQDDAMLSRIVLCRPEYVKQSVQSNGTAGFM